MDEVLRVKRLSPTATLPQRAHSRDAGLDLFADLGGEGRELLVLPGARARIPTGLAMATPPGTYGRIADKSGLADSRGITILAGVCDERFRGEYEVLALNTGADPWVIRHGTKVAQLVLERVSYAEPVEVNELNATERGADGWSSTGLDGVRRFFPFPRSEP